jgi:outer membrane protein OmpA-like peptidoglycan-associated protein
MGTAQNISSFTPQNGFLELNFLIDRIESRAQSTIFNILVVKNNSDAQFTGKVNLSVPLSWSLIGDGTFEIQVGAKDSIALPVRISIAKSAIGDIGYSVVGTITDIDGKNLKSAYSFVTIPRNTNFAARTNKRLTYIGKDQDQVQFEYLLDNKGNVNELVHLEAYTSENISINGSDEYTPYVAEYSLNPNSDSIIKLDIIKSKSAQNASFASLRMFTSSADTSFNRTFWIRILDNIFIYKIPESDKCAIIELFARNLLTETEPFYSLLAKGRILFKGQQDLYYEYRNFNIQRTFNTDSKLGVFHKGYIGYQTKYTDLRVGSIEKTIEQDLYGNGVNLQLKYQNTKLEGVYIQDIYERYNSMGGRMQVPLMNMLLNAGTIYTDIYSNLSKTYLYFGGASFSFLKRNTINFVVGYTSIDQGITNENYIGYGLDFKYALKFKKAQFDVKVNYGDPYYVGAYKGRFTIDGNFTYKFGNSSSFYAKYQKYNNLGQYDVYSSISFNYKRNYDYWHLNYTKNINPFLSYLVGSDVRLESTDQFPGTQPLFRTLDTKFFISTNIRTKYSKIIFAPKISFGPVSMEVPENTSTTISPLLVNTFALSFSVYKDNIGLFSAFRYGPININENYLYFIDRYFSKWFYIMPYYSELLLDGRLKVDIRANYVNNISANENNFSLNSQFSLYLPYDLTFFFYNTISTRSKIDRASNIKYNYTSIYFDFGIRKEFNCNQPRMKFYDLEAIFFKDLNGNRLKDKNEPGISNVYVSIIRDTEQDFSFIDNGFSEAELMTDQFGSIQYRNIPDGNYLIKYQLLGDIAGNYSLEELETPVLMDDDKIIYIPYLENNKIIGKVVLNRDPLSSLGQIDISNIRVIAEDTQGRTYSALTDFAGNFVLYTPKADHYVVKINNVFYESFDIQQSEFIVKFNGYKQFEVTFVFDEKKRKINFDNNVTDNEVTKMDELQVIRKTTLTGKIRDAISLEPIEATVKIIDNKTNKEVSSAISNRLNGNYTISYVAGDHFRIEVKAEGHWDHVENLYIEQIISIQNIAKDIIMNKLSDGPKNQTFIIYDEKEQEKFTENFKPGQKIPVNNLNFEEKETRLSPNAYPDLDRLIDLLKKNANVRIEVAGHADDTGKDRTDNLLALRRAKAVARYLSEHGLSEDRIEVKSYSNSRPLVPGINDKAKQRNRRVEITVL